jgi:redox-sensitive bicupin YhaK (pirin superfamily)
MNITTGQLVRSIVNQTENRRPHAHGGLETGTLMLKGSLNDHAKACSKKATGLDKANAT